MCISWDFLYRISYLYRTKSFWGIFWKCYISDIMVFFTDHMVTVSKDLWFVCVVFMGKIWALVLTVPYKLFCSYESSGQSLKLLSLFPHIWTGTINRTPSFTWIRLKTLRAWLMPNTHGGSLHYHSSEWVNFIMSWHSSQYSTTVFTWFKPTMPWPLLI